LGKLLQLFLERLPCGDGLLGVLALVGGLEEELLDMALGQALGQIIEGAVALAALAAAVLTATSAEAFDEGGPE
jgi:hypothetical protein